MVQSSDCSIWHVLFTILTTPPLVILSLFFALLAERAARARWFFRLAFFAPYILPSAVMALIWIWIYTPTLGLLDSALAKIHISSPPAWLGAPNWAMTSIALATVWWTLGFNFVLYLAGLQEIPRDLYEAAAIDGAGPWQQIRTITIPLLSRTTTLVVVLQVILVEGVRPDVHHDRRRRTSAPDRRSNTSTTSGSPITASAPPQPSSTLFFVLVLAVSAVWLIITRRQERQAS